MNLFALPLLGAVLIGLPEFVDVTHVVGLGRDVVPESVARVCFVNLEGDHRPDAVVEHLVVAWPDENRTVQTFAGVWPGRYALNQGGELRRLEP